MKIIAFITILFFLVINASAQTNDLIITKVTDSIKCNITLVNDDNIFYEYFKKKTKTTSFINLTKVASYTYKNETINPEKTDSIILNYEGVDEPYIHCELVGYAKIFSFSGKVNVSVDFGKAAIEMLKNEEGRNKSFNSMIDALNYMGQFGWEFVQAYTVGDSKTGYVYHWLLKKKIKK